MNIPANLIEPMVDIYLESRDQSIEELSLILGYDDQTLRRRFLEGELTFDMADKVLCKLNCFTSWYEEPLSEFYYAPVLVKQDRTPKLRCARRGCSNEFEVAPRGHNKLYCSNACKASVQRSRRQKRRQVKKRYGTRFDRCPNGHDRSPENISVRANGKIVCTACNREKAAARYARDEDYRRRKIAQSRVYKQRRREAVAA